MKIKDFSKNVLTLNFASQSMADIFTYERRAIFEENFSRLIGRQIKVAKVIGGSSNVNLEGIDEHEKKNIKAAMNVFQTENFSVSNENNF